LVPRLQYQRLVGAWQQNLGQKGRFSWLWRGSGGSKHQQRLNRDQVFRLTARKAGECFATGFAEKRLGSKVAMIAIQETSSLRRPLVFSLALDQKASEAVAGPGTCVLRRPGHARSQQRRRLARFPHDEKPGVNVPEVSELHNDTEGPEMMGFPAPMTSTSLRCCILHGMPRCIPPRLNMAGPSIASIKGSDLEGF
jgi:hypothetical protein